MLPQRLRRWPNIKTSSLQRVVFVGTQGQLPDGHVQSNLQNDPLFVMLCLGT